MDSRRVCDGSQSAFVKAAGYVTLGVYITDRRTAAAAGLQRGGYLAAYLVLRSTLWKESEERFLVFS